MSFPEAATAFTDPLSAIVPDLDHSNDEEREILVGTSERNRLLIVSFTERPPNVRVISCVRAHAAPVGELASPAKESVVQTSRRRTTLWLLIGCAGLLLLPFGCYGLWWSVSVSNNRGSPELAAEWRDALLAAAGPDEAAAADPDIVVLRFPNGEWVFGKSQDSHGIWRRGGGTLVVRDSRGRVRAFFGHMCGPRYLAFEFGSDYPSLDAFYDSVLQHRIVEHIFPDAAEPGVAPGRRPAR